MAAMPFVKNLDTPLLRLSPVDVWSARQACTGVHVFGQIGGGKTTLARMLRGAFLRAGAGGCVTVAKPSEIELWQRETKEHGRANSLVLVNETSEFNFLVYELARQGPDGLGSVVDGLMRIVEIGKRVGITTSQRAEEPFWEGITRTTLRHSLLPLYVAGGTVSIPDLIRFIRSTPRNREESMDTDWQQSSFMYGVLNAAVKNPKVRVPDGLMKDCVEYWGEGHVAAPEKTLGNVVMTVCTVLDRFTYGRLARLFGRGITLVPELSFHGAILLLAMPTATWNEDGIIAQQVLKFFWQRAVLARNSMEERHRERLIFLYSDEAQETVHASDGAFLGECRDAKCCVTYLSQTIPAYFSKIGTDKPENVTHDLIGKFGNHIFASNICSQTNQIAAQMIGKVMKRHNTESIGTSDSFNAGMSAGDSANWGTSSNSGFSYGKGGGGSNFGSGSSSGSGSNWGANRGQGQSRSDSRGYTEGMEFVIEPGDFARILKTGGPANRNEVTAIWLQGGHVFKSTGSNVMLARFKQQ